MKGATLLATLQALGVASSFSRPGVSNDNPYSESLFKTLKYHCTYPNKPFKERDEARQWVEKFIEWYNYHHKHSGIKFITPHQRHIGEERELLAHRKEVYQRAKNEKPARWSGGIRNWNAAGPVWLNPGKNSAKLEEMLVRKIAA